MHVYIRSRCLSVFDRDVTARRKKEEVDSLLSWRGGVSSAIFRKRIESRGGNWRASLYEIACIKRTSSPDWGRASSVAEDRVVVVGVARATSYSTL